MFTVTEYQDSLESRQRLQQALALWRSEGFTFWPTDDIINACQIPETALILLCRQDGELQGLALARRLDQTVELFYIYVIPMHRGKKLSHILLDRLCDHFKNAADEMFLEVRASNLAAQSTYKKYGFAKIALRKAYYPDGEDAMIMQLPFKEHYGDNKKE